MACLDMQAIVCRKPLQLDAQSAIDLIDNSPNSVEQLSQQFDAAHFNDSSVMQMAALVSLLRIMWL